MTPGQYRPLAMKQISRWPLLSSLASVILLLGCGQAASNQSSSADSSAQAGSVQAWVTLTDQSKLLQPVIGMQLSGAAPLALNIEVDASKRYQEMVGFGANISDASAWLIQNRMNPQQRAALLQDLFGPAPGLGFSFTRLTIGASDFSLRHYSSGHDVV